MSSFNKSLKAFLLGEFRFTLQSSFLFGTLWKLHILIRIFNLTFKLLFSRRGRSWRRYPRFSIGWSRQTWQKRNFLLESSGIFLKLLMKEHPYSRLTFLPLHPYILPALCHMSFGSVKVNQVTMTLAVESYMQRCDWPAPRTEKDIYPLGCMSKRTCVYRDVLLDTYPLFFEISVIFIE